MVCRSVSRIRQRRKTRTQNLLRLDALGSRNEDDRRAGRKTQRRSRFRHQRRFADTDTRLACHVQAGECQPPHLRDCGDACETPRLPSHRRAQTRAGHSEHHSGRVEQNVGRGILAGVCSQSQIPAQPVFRLREGKSVHQRQSRIGVHCQIHARTQRTQTGNVQGNSD